MAIKWTEDMDAQLKARYSTANIKAFALEMGVSRKALITRAKTLGLKREVRIGGKFFSPEQISSILKYCAEMTKVDLAKKLGIKKSSLVMYLRRRCILGLNENEKNKKIHKKEDRTLRQKIKNEKEKREKAQSVTPLIERVKEGEFYYVPFDHKIGAFRVKETRSVYDEKMFNKGWYFKTENEAKTYSFLTQRRLYENSGDDELDLKLIFDKNEI